MSKEDGMESEHEEERGETVEEPREEQEGVLTGTDTEEAPGVGGTGDHPAPAVMRDPETGEIRSAGLPADGASEQAPADEGSDETAGDGVSDEAARERLNEVKEPEPHEIDRPDLGTV